MNYRRTHVDIPTAARDRKPTRSARLASLAITGAMAFSATGAFAAEVCRFAGSTDFAGHVAVTTRVAAVDGLTTVDVAMTFESTTMVWLHIRYLVEEVSTWRGGELQRVAVNTRYLVGDHVVRQQWDDFQRAPEGLAAYRVQAKGLADFRVRHPGFVQHWDLATFGQPWLHDYRAASPERRADLDLKASPLPSGLRSPLALAFYWVRWLPRAGQDVPMFLPGYKADRLVDLPITGAPLPSGTQWHATLHHPTLNRTPASTATAWTSSDGHLLRLAFELHQPRGSARGSIDQEGCEGAPPDRQ